MNEYHRKMWCVSEARLALYYQYIVPIGATAPLSADQRTALATFQRETAALFARYGTTADEFTSWSEESLRQTLAMRANLDSRKN